MGMVIKVTLYIFGVLFLLGGLFLIFMSQGAQAHTRVAVDPLNAKAMVFKLSYSENIQSVFGNYYSLNVHFKTSNGDVVYVFLTNSKYVNEYSSGSGIVHYYKYTKSDEGTLSVTIPVDEEIAVVVINEGMSSTMVNLDLTTNISDTLFGGGIFAIVLGIGLIIGGYYHKVSEKTPKAPEKEYTPQLPPPEFTGEIEESPKFQSKEEIIREIMRLRELYNKGILTQEEFEEKRAELVKKIVKI